jgi:hypothetical protein
MSRYLVPLAVFGYCVILLTLPAIANAETTGTTYTVVGRPDALSQTSIRGPAAPTKAAACTAYLQMIHSQYAPWAPITAQYGTDPDCLIRLEWQSDYWPLVYDVVINEACPVGQASFGSAFACWMISADSSCSDATSQGRQTFPPGSVCDGSCVVGSLSFDDAYVLPDEAVGPHIPTFWSFSGTKTGATCTQDGANPDPGAAPTSCPAGHSAGTVNGKDACIKCSTPDCSGGGSGGGTGGGTDGGSGGGTGGGTDGGSGGGGTGGGTDGGSGGGGSGGGSGGTGTGEGAGTLCKLFPGVLACQRLGSLDPAGPLPERSIGVSSITPTGGFGPSRAGASCPADAHVSTSFGSLSWSWDGFCRFADGIAPIVIALAWLSAGIGLFSFIRK